AWYQTRFAMPWDGDSHQVSLRFGSVNYLADVWLNGAYLGQHVGGHLPFNFEIGAHLRPEANLLVLRVDGRLAPTQVPPGRESSGYGSWDPPRQYPDVSFDYFPYCGIQRPVQLVSTAPGALADLTVVTEIAGADGMVHVSLKRAAADDVIARLTLRGHGAEVRGELTMGEQAETTLRVSQAAFWSPAAPHRYELTVELLRDGLPFDRYSLPIGIRTIAVEGDQLLLNGEPIMLRGFGRHEDFPVLGRGFHAAVAVKDYGLMQWLGANSFRTTHYPYAEETLELADRLGFLVIDEIPAVGLCFDDGEANIAERLRMCEQQTHELVQRDKNHPSVIMWCLANEPRSYQGDVVPFFRTLYDLTKRLDPTRPATLVSDLGVLEESFAFYDVVCMNRYYGWYTEQGRLETGAARLAEELDAIYARFPKPLILTEFGADAIAGMHAQPPEMWSEEYQAELIRRYIAVLNSKPYVVGQHVWNLCDFKTGQGVMRAGGLNHKGIFTRDRRPKLAAHVLRELWSIRPKTEDRRPEPAAPSNAEAQRARDAET
nr:hypothetical protein [Chloroflexaceae bacterium]